MSTRFGQFMLEKKLGHGGLGETWIAADAKKNTVALKILCDELSGDPEYLKAADAEGRIIHGLNHPNVVRLLNAGMADKRAFLVYEYKPASNLQTVLEHDGRFTPRDTVRVARSLLLGVQALHSLDKFHGGIAPGNILIMSGNAMLTDAGQARHDGAIGVRLENDTVHGVPHFIAPEQFTDGVEQTPAIDAWAIGAVLFYMLTGRPPFIADNLADLIKHILNDAPPPLTQYVPDISSDISELIMQCLDKTPANRPPTVAEITAVLEAEFPDARPDDGEMLIEDGSIVDQGVSPLTAPRVLGDLAGIPNLWLPGYEPPEPEPESPSVPAGGMLGLSAEDLAQHSGPDLSPPEHDTPDASDTSDAPDTPDMDTGLDDEQDAPITPDAAPAIMPASSTKAQDTPKPEPDTSGALAYQGTDEPILPLIRAQLTLDTGTGTPISLFFCAKRRIQLGRNSGDSSENDIVLRMIPQAEFAEESRRISGTHLSSEFADGAFFITDMHSSNGTTLNGVLMTGNTPTRLDAPAMIDVGGVLTMELIPVESTSNTDGPIAIPDAPRNISMEVGAEKVYSHDALIFKRVNNAPSHLYVHIIRQFSFGAPGTPTGQFLPITGLTDEEASIIYYRGTFFIRPITGRLSVDGIGELAPGATAPLTPGCSGRIGNATFLMETFDWDRFKGR